jgi:uncharacterized protein with GYD domain
MPTYISLVKWTDQGAKNVKETLNRAEQGMAAAEQMGGRFTQMLWTQGAFDMISISEWPDEESAQAYFLQIASQGSIRTETLRAFDRNEMKRILSKLG